MVKGDNVKNYAYWHAQQMKKLKASISRGQKTIEQVIEEEKGQRVDEKKDADAKEGRK